MPEYGALATYLTALALVLPFWRVLKGPTIYDRMVGVGVAGTKTTVLICLVGVAPIRPAEFVIFRIGQWTGDARR